MLVRCDPLAGRFITTNVMVFVAGIVNSADTEESTTHLSPSMTHLDETIGYAPASVPPSLPRSLLPGLCLMALIAVLAFWWPGSAAAGAVGITAAAVALLLAVSARTTQGRRLAIVLAALACTPPLQFSLHALALLAALVVAAALLAPAAGHWRTRVIDMSLAAAAPLLAIGVGVVTPASEAALPARGQTVTEVAGRIDWLGPDWQLAGLALMLVSGALAGLGAAVLWVRSFDRCRERPSRIATLLRPAVVFCLAALSAEVAIAFGHALVTPEPVFGQSFLVTATVCLILPGVALADALTGRRAARTVLVHHRSAAAAAVVAAVVLQMLALPLPGLSGPWTSLADGLRAVAPGEPPAAAQPPVRQSPAMLSIPTMPSGSPGAAPAGQTVSVGAGSKSTRLLTRLPVHTKKPMPGSSNRGIAPRHSVHYWAALETARAGPSSTEFSVLPDSATPAG